MVLSTYQHHIMANELALVGQVSCMMPSVKKVVTERYKAKWLILECIVLPTITPAMDSEILMLDSGSHVIASNATSSDIKACQLQEQVELMQNLFETGTWRATANLSSLRVDLRGKVIAKSSSCYS